MGANAKNRPPTVIEQSKWLGVNYVDDPGVMKSTQVPKAVNVDFGEPIGDATKRKGIERLITSLGAGGVKGMHTFKHSTGDILLMAHGTAIYRLEDDSTPALTKTSKADWDAGTGTNTDTATSEGDVTLAVSGANFSEADTLDADFNGTNDSTVVGSNSVKLTTSIDSNTVLLLHCNGTDGSTTFTDEIGKTVTAAGDAQIDTAQKKFGTGSALFDGTGDYLSVTDSEAWDFGTGDFTIDMWVRAARWSKNSSTLVGNSWGTSAHPRYWRFSIESAGIRFRYVDTISGINVTVIGTATISLNTWYHVAVVRNGNDFKVFVNGTGVGEETSTLSITSDDKILIGHLPVLYSDPLDGWIDELRISKGVARWVEDFTPFPAAYSLTSYNLTGTYEHPVQDISTIALTTGVTIAYNKTTPTNTSVTVQTATSTDGGLTYGDWTTRVTGATVIASGTDVSNYRLKWRAVLASDGNGLATPSLDDVTVAGNTGYWTLGQWMSPAYDLVNKPSTATLAWTQTTPAGTSIAWYARCSDNSSTWGDWRNIATSGNGIPLGRYVQIKAVMTGTVAATPTISDITIDYSTGFTTATVIDITPLGRDGNALTGNRVRFVSYLDKCYCVDGLRPFILYLDGTTVKARKAGVDPPASAPTLAAGAGTGLTGDYYGKVTFVSTDGVESDPSEASAKVTLSNKNITWTIPTGPEGTASRKLYRTRAASALTFYLVTTIEDNTTTSYTDGALDARITVGIVDTNAIPPVNATIVYEYQNYMFYGNDSGELWFSKVGSPEQVPNNGSDIAVKTFNGPVLAISEINNAITIHGDEYVSIITSDGPFLLSTDPEIDTTRVRTIDKAGALTHESVANCTDPDLRHIMVFPTRTGVRFLMPGIQEQSLESVPLSRNIQPYYDRAISRGNMAGYFFNNRYLLSMTYQDPTAETAAANNVIFVYDFRSREWTGPWTIGAACFTETGEELYCGSSTIGAAYRMFSGNSDDGENIEMILDLPAKAPSGEHRTHRFRRFLVTVSADSVTTETVVKPKVDSAEATVSIGTMTDSFTGEDRPGHDNMRSQKYPIYLPAGHTISHRIEDDSINPVSVQRVITEYELIPLRT